MNLDQMPTVYREAVAVFEAFRKLGFSADDIYFVTSGPLMSGVPAELRGSVQCSILLRTQGKEFVAITGFLFDTPETIQKTWFDLATAINNHGVPQDQLDRAWQTSEVFNKKLDFLQAVLFKGFTIPGTTAEMEAVLR